MIKLNTTKLKSVKKEKRKMYRFENPRPDHKRVGDCVKRACCLASEINYHDISVMLNRYRKISGGSKFNSRENWKPFVENVLLGWKNEKDMRFANNGHRYTVESFANNHPTSKHILRCSKHLVCVKDGDYLDTWDSSEKGVYIDYLIPSYVSIVEHIKTNYPKLCKGLSLDRI